MNHLPIEELGIVIAAGGSGARFANGENIPSKMFYPCSKLADAAMLPEQLAKFADLPLFLASVITCMKIVPAENLIVAARKEDLASFASAATRHLPHCRIKIIAGGETRMHSVCKGLSALPKVAKFAAVHDAARPFISRKLFLECYYAACRYQSAVCARTVTDTVKKINNSNRITETVERQGLCMVETPQIFPLAELKKAYRKALADKVCHTDDAGVMEASGCQPYLFLHHEYNRKVTYC